MPHAGARSGRGLAGSPEAELLIRHYLQSRPPIDTLILGCAHYPLLRGAIQRVLGDELELVDSADATANAVGESVGQTASLGDGRVVHYVTGDSAAFAHTARVIGGVEGKITLLPDSELAASECRT